MEESTKEQDWTTRQIAALVTVQQTGAVPDNDWLGQIWRQVILPNFICDTEASKFFGISPNTVGRELKPTLATVLRVCKCSGLELKSMLSDGPAKLKPHFTQARTPLRWERLSETEVVRRVEKVLIESSSTDLTLRGLCKKVGVTKLTIYRQYPELWGRLVGHFRQKRREKVEIAWRIRLQKAVEFIRREGARVTSGEIMKAAGFRSKHWPKAFIAEARRLGALPESQFALTKTKAFVPSVKYKMSALE